MLPCSIFSVTGPAGPTVEYRLSSAAVLRMLGAALVALGVLTVAGSLLVALTDLSALPLVLVLAFVVVAVVVVAAYLRFGTLVLRSTAEGYRIRLVRGAGVTEGRWSSVEDAVTTTRHDVPCVMLRLRDGRLLLNLRACAPTSRSVTRPARPGTAGRSGPWRVGCGPRRRSDRDRARRHR